MRETQRRAALTPSLEMTQELLLEALLAGATPLARAILATNSLGETSNSSIIPAGDALLIRTHQHLWSIAQPKK
jgi:hypothetical protein